MEGFRELIILQEKLIQKANDCGGVVVDADQNYIWERGNRDLKYSIDTEDADTEQLRQALAGGKSAVDAIAEVYGSVMDLSGCTIDELLYNVNQGTAVNCRLRCANNADDCWL